MFRQFHQASCLSPFRKAFEIQVLFHKIHLFQDAFRCEIPPIKHFHHKAIVLTIKNNETTIITRKMHYLHIPVIQSIFPSYMPAFGGLLYINGDYFSKLYKNATLKLGKKWLFNCTILHIDRVQCNITGMPDKNVHVYEISLIFNNHTLYSKMNLSFYGLKRITPKKGPVEKSTKVSNS